MHRDKETTYRIMSAVKSEGTSPEKILGSALWKLGLRYRKNYKGLEGKPDFAFISAKVAVFCDGDFWHGNNWRIRGMKNLKEELSRYNNFWQKKILNNITRDENVNCSLKKEGWIVLRFWESDIKKDVNKCALKAYRIIKKHE